MAHIHLQNAVRKAGSQDNLARAIRVHVAGSKLSQASISNWLDAPIAPPAEFVLPIARCSGFEPTPHQLRPDLYPNPTDALPPGIVIAIAAGKWPPPLPTTEPGAA